MFWIQIIVPISLTTTGLVLLFADSRNQKVFIRQTLNNSRTKMLEFSEKQEDKSEVNTRLIEIGQVESSAYGEFRYRQLLAAIAGALIPIIGAFLLIINLFTAIALSLFTGIGGYLLYDRHLSTLVKRRRDLVESEFPAIIEMLTLAIAAGETPLGSFARIADRSDALLAKEFEKVVRDVRAGRPFHEALDAMGRTLKSPSIRRFVDALVMAMMRGAPIVDVLHRHVAEARINQRNLVMDKAGKAETTMMVPIVFLILPISVLFALWPSINQLSFFAG